MNFEQWRPVWERVRSGQHTIVIGPDEIPPAPTDLHVLRINCATPLGTNGSLHEAQTQMDRLLGIDLPTVAKSSAQSGGAKPLRFSLLGESPGRAFASVFVETCNRLADWDGGRAALCFIAVDTVDPATRITLTEIINRPHWLRLPLIMLVRIAETDAVVDLINDVRSHAGAESIIEISADMPEDINAFSWSALTPETLQVLRAGAVIGARFEADLIARLLDKTPGRILEKLQYAADTGAPLTDQGHGCFALAPTAVAELRAQLLPSLLSFWHQRLGDLLSERRSETNQTEIIDDDGDKSVTPVKKPPESAQTQPRFVDLFEPRLPLKPQESLSEFGVETPAPAAPQAAQRIRIQPLAGEVSPQDTPQTDQARAAMHLEKAGQSEAAVQQYLGAVRELAARGDAQRAYLIAQQALQLLSKLPASQGRALLHAALLLEVGQVQWQSYGQDTHFTLAQSLESLQAASAVLPAETPAELLGRLATVTAGVCYDLGDLESLERALSELTEASRRLIAAGASLQAACLLSDQAAIYVRLGDPVRATHLLNKALQLFEQLLTRKSNEALALAELAQAHHLLARLPLHARIRSGRDQDAYAMALEHAAKAENNYRQLNWRRELGRVWETMGRLELRRGRADKAHERLKAALTLQRQLVDVTGLARSSAALAELFAVSGQMAEALALLADSIALNHEKGSPIGLAFNRQTLSTLTASISQHSADTDTNTEPLHEQLTALQRQLVQAEAIFGRVTLPLTGNSTPA